MPYKISTLLYCFNDADEVLLMCRAQEPNLGRWSPAGGKLRTEAGESPHTCACREAHEEMGQILQPTDLHLTGIVAEQGYLGQSHWLMFLFEIKPRLKAVPPPHREGSLSFLPAPSCHCCHCRKRMRNKSGRCFGAIAGDFLRRTAIARRQAKTRLDTGGKRADPLNHHHA